MNGNLKNQINIVFYSKKILSPKWASLVFVDLTLKSLTPSVIGALVLILKSSATKSLFYYRLVWPVALAQVLPRTQLIFPSKTWFFGIYLNFQRQKSLQNQYLPHSESKSYQTNSIKSCSSRSFQQHQRHIPIPPKFSATI